MRASSGKNKKATVGGQMAMKLFQINKMYDPLNLCSSELLNFQAVCNKNVDIAV